jgi:hypothetical protein
MSIAEDKPHIFFLKGGGPYQRTPSGSTLLWWGLSGNKMKWCGLSQSLGDQIWKMHLADRDGTPTVFDYVDGTIAAPTR